MGKNTCGSKLLTETDKLQLKYHCWGPLVWRARGEYLASSGVGLLRAWGSPPSRGCRPWAKLWVGGGALFGRVGRVDRAAPACQALHLSVTTRQGSGRFGTWERRSGRRRRCWVEQVTTTPRTQCSQLMLEVLLIGQHAGRYHLSTVKRR